MGSERIHWKKATIASGASLSDAVKTLGYEVVVIQQAASCEGTAFTAQGSIDGATYADIQTDSAEWSVTKSATVAQVLLLPETKQFRGLASIKIRSGTSGSPTVQVTADAVVWIGMVER